MSVDVVAFSSSQSVLKFPKERSGIEGSVKQVCYNKPSLFCLEQNLCFI